MQQNKPNESLIYLYFGLFIALLVMSMTALADATTYGFAKSFNNRPINSFMMLREQLN